MDYVQGYCLLELIINNTCAYGLSLWPALMPDDILSILFIHNFRAVDAGPPRFLPKFPTYSCTGGDHITEWIRCMMRPMYRSVILTFVPVQRNTSNDVHFNRKYRKSPAPRCTRTHREIGLRYVAYHRRGWRFTKSGDPVHQLLSCFGCITELRE